MSQSKKKYSFFYRNGLTLTFLTLLLVTLAGQIYNGRQEWNQELTERYHQAPLGWAQYLHSGHFISATFENWESEFLQMGMYVLGTVFLRQKGAPDSRPLEKGTEPPSPSVTPESPWPVRKGGWWRKVYEHSFSITYFLLFLFCFGMHMYLSWLHFNTMQSLDGKETEALAKYLTNSQLWFESMQNWQSEFMAVVSLTVLGIYLREKDSTESKEVEDPHSKTGD